MQFKCQVDMDNAAFDDAPASELARILEKMARQIRDGATEGAPRDVNGNQVGYWAVEG